VEDKEWEARCMEVYAAMLDCMDQGIGRLVETLKKNGQYDNTLILYLQDNGGCAEAWAAISPSSRVPDKPTLPPLAKDYLQPDMIPKQTRDGYPVRQGKGVMPGPADTYIGYGLNWANVSNTPFREYKHWEHEGGISTPLIAHWPAGIGQEDSAAGRRQPCPCAGRPTARSRAAVVLGARRKPGGASWQVETGVEASGRVGTVRHGGGPHGNEQSGGEGAAAGRGDGGPVGEVGPARRRAALATDHR
jgi:hypothetical protein